MKFVFGLLVLLLCPAFVDSQGVVAVRCGQLLNPVDGILTANVAVLVQGEKISGIGSPVPKDAAIIDLSKY
ncbi:MAG TPA: hypothetical protein VJ521_11200, partial [Acidobacteriota bacterium]|nr:hypothetical protein [Acidobacteriota bacterium]